MRILLLGSNHRAEIRGWTVALHALACTHRDRGHEVTLVQAALPEHRKTLEGIRQIYTRVTRKSRFPVLFALRSLKPYDVVHANEEGSALLALRSRVRRFPLVVQFQVPRVRTESFLRANSRWRYLAIAAHTAPMILTPSQWLADEFARRYSLPTDRFRVIPYGIGQHWFDAYRSRSERAESSPRVVLVNMKGVDVALRAFARATAGLEVQLDLFGVGKSLEAHRTLAGELGIADRVHFRGFVPNRELPAAVACADLLLHPTPSESFGQVLAEAATVGIPSVTTRVNAVPEVVEDGKTGLLCPLNDVDAFANALRTLLGDAELRRSMGEAARKRAEADWHWPEVARRIETEIYAPLIDAYGRH